MNRASFLELVDFFRECDRPVHLEMLLKMYESVTDVAARSCRCDESSMLWSMARLNYLEHRTWLYRLSGTFPPTSSLVPTHICDRVGSCRSNVARTQWIVPTNGINPNSLYHLDWMFKI
jgi:hypothetical protein